MTSNILTLEDTVVSIAKTTPAQQRSLDPGQKLFPVTGQSLIIF